MDMMPTGIEVADLSYDPAEPRDRRGRWTTAGGNIRNPGEYAGLTDEQYDKYVAPSLKQPEMFWRTHQRGESFSRDNAWSADLQGGEEQKGYSAFRSPEELHRYITQSGTGVFGGWDVGSRDVIRFRGHEIGTGADGEPLVEPVDDDPVERMSWDKFARRISRTRRQAETSNTGMLSTDLAAWEHEPRDKAGRWTGVGGGMTPAGDLPPDPGTRPIPAGHIRLWHYTPLENADSIRKGGMERKFARGDAANYDLTDPSAGMWASTKRPDDILGNHEGGFAVVEFHASPDEISQNAESPWQAMNKDHTWNDEQVQEWARGYHHVIMRGDVPAADIVDIHEPWHGAARYMRDDDPTLASYQWLKEKGNAEDPAYAPYIRGLAALEKRQAETSNTGLLSTDLAAWEHEPRNPHTGEWVGLNAKDYEGTVGRKDHITRTESGQIPLAAIAGLRGAEGEMPGEHRNMQGARWETFKADIAARGIRNPVFVTVDHGQEPKISEGSHRRDAAAELGLSHVPVEIRYYGHAEQQGTVLDRRQAELSQTCPDCGCPTDGLVVQLAGEAWEHEPRDRFGRWMKTGEIETGSWDEIRDDMSRYTARNHHPDVGAKLAVAYVQVQQGDYTGATISLYDAADLAQQHSKSHSVAADHYRFLGDQIEEKARGAGPLEESAAKVLATASPTALVGGGHSKWDGKVTVFDEEADKTRAGSMGWDGTMSLGDREVEKVNQIMADAAAGKPVTLERPLSVYLHELVHGVEAPLNPAHKASGRTERDDQILSILDRLSLSGSASDLMNASYPISRLNVYRQQADPEITKHEMQDLVFRGFVRLVGTRPDGTPTYGLTRKAYETRPVDDTFLHQKAYRRAHVATAEEGYTELGTVLHMPEFLDQIGIGHAETPVIAITNEGKIREHFNRQVMYDKQGELQAIEQLAGSLPGKPGGMETYTALADARYELFSGDPDPVKFTQHLESALGHSPHPEVRERLIRLLNDLDVGGLAVTEHVTLREMAERNLHPEKIDSGSPYDSYSWETRAASLWAREMARVEGHTDFRPGSPGFRRYVELADEVNQQGPAGKMPVMARQVMRATGSPETGEQQLKDLADQIEVKWPGKPGETVGAAVHGALNYAQLSGLNPAGVRALKYLKRLEGDPSSTGMATLGAIQISDPYIHYDDIEDMIAKGFIDEIEDQHGGVLVFYKMTPKGIRVMKGVQV